jgi:5-methylcytosine-specific restriction endonuclease McrA
MSPEEQARYAHWLVMQEIRKFLLDSMTPQEIQARIEEGRENRFKDARVKTKSRRKLITPRENRDDGGRTLEIQAHRCYLCGKAMRVSQHTRDHVRPRSKGHSFHRNKLFAHGRCNSKKGNRDPYPCELLYLEIINIKLYGEDNV